MNKVIIINLGGTAWQLEEGGYDVLRAYLDTAAARLSGNPDRDEILSDIEWAIAEKFRPLLGSHKTVVLTKEVTAVMAAMGPIEAAPGAASEEDPSATGSAGGAAGFGAAKAPPGPGAGPAPRRLYRLRDGDMIAGVCNGLAAYAHVDPTLVRLAFVFLTILWGTGVLVYIVMAIVVPEAVTPEEKAAAAGDPATAQEFIRRAKAGYYEAIKGFPDKQARRAWKRRFKQKMRANADQWRFHWERHWAGPVTGHPALGIALPFISVLHGAFKVLWLCALVSLLATGAVLGLALPDKVPVWVAALLLFFLYGLVTGPLKIARKACYWGYGEPKPAWALFFLLDAMVGVTIFAALLWLAFLYFPQLTQAVHSLPGLIHQAADDIQTWWKKN
jgi:phage shock protein PspC (stress-responsive transcriptional regulator)